MPFRKADKVDVHIFWKDIGLEGRIPVEGLDGQDVLALQEYLLALQQAFMETVKERLVAKSITYHV